MAAGLQPQTSLPLGEEGNEFSRIFTVAGGGEHKVGAALPLWKAKELLAAKLQLLIQGTANM